MSRFLVIFCVLLVDLAAALTFRSGYVTDSPANHAAAGGSCPFGDYELITSAAECTAARTAFGATEGRTTYISEVESTTGEQGKNWPYGCITSWEWSYQHYGEDWPPHQTSWLFNSYLPNLGMAGKHGQQAIVCKGTPTALGDAHFFGPHGDRTDFKGRNNTYYNVLSTNNLTVNVLFLHDTYNWRNKVVFGSWMKAVAVSAKIAENKLVKAAYHCERPAIMDVHVEGEAEPNGPINLGSAFTFENVKVSLSADFVFVLSNGEWEVEAKNSYLPYKSQNMRKKRLDIDLKTIANVDKNPVAPHGLIGQAWDRDDKMVIGALDDYTKAGHVVETTANAEGAIEGSAADYEIDPLNPFSTNFKYSRFGLERAAPRDLNLLSGKKLFALKKTASSGAMNDEDNEA